MSELDTAPYVEQVAAVLEKLPLPIQGSILSYLYQRVAALMQLNNPPPQFSAPPVAQPVAPAPAQEQPPPVPAPEPESPAPAPAPSSPPLEISSAVHGDLTTLRRRKSSSVMEWAAEYLDREVGGKTPPQVKKSKHAPVKGEVRIAAMHKAAVEALGVDAMNCPDGCRGSKKSCTLRICLRVMSEIEGGPLSRTPRQGLWGALYVFDRP